MPQIGTQIDKNYALWSQGLWMRRRIVKGDEWGSQWVPPGKVNNGKKDSQDEK
jgi:hypothetical protein